MQPHDNSSASDRLTRTPRRWARLLGAWVAVSFVAGSLAVGATAAHATGSVTGGSNFSNVVLELPQGSQVDDIYEMNVSNQSNDVVTAEFQWSAPYGIVLTPKKKDFTLLPGVRTSAPFNITVQDDTPGGEYTITTGIFRRDVKSVPDEVVFVPGVTQTFKIRVLGDSATAKINVVDKYKHEPVSGLVSVARVMGSVRTEIARALSDKLNLKAVPGVYEANVFLDGRRVASKSFTLVKDQTSDILVEVEAIFIRDVALLPQKTAGKIQTLEVAATVENSLRALPKATLNVEVLRNNKTLETLEMQRFSPLEAGNTAASLRYVPKDGWKPGKYTFIVRLEAPEFSVKASNEPSYSIGGAVMSPLGWILAALGLLALIIAVAVAVRMRKRKQSDGSGTSGRRIPDRNRPARDATRVRSR